MSSAWAGLSILAAAFANSVEFLIITIGVSTGIFKITYSPKSQPRNQRYGSVVSIQVSDFELSFNQHQF